MRKRLELFLRANSHLLVVVGALIVFLTFFIKEGLREHWKGTADAIETAEYFYPLPAQTAEIRQEVRKVGDQQAQIAHPRQELLHFSLFKIDSDFLSSQLNTLNDLEMSAANRRILVDVLPDGDALRKEADRVDAQLADLSTTLHAEDQEVAEINYKETLAERGHPLSDDQREAEFDKLEPHLSAEVSKSYDALTSTGGVNGALNKNVLEHARAIRSRNGRYSTVSWWLSAFLFAFGWSLGLAGKLYGVPGVAEE